MTRPHITPDEAATQAATLARLTWPMRDHLAPAVLHHFHALVRDPRSSSDLLLITADALREAADLDPWPDRGATLARLADLNNNTPAAMEHRRQDRAKLARLFPTLVRPDGGCHLSGGGP